MGGWAGGLIELSKISALAFIRLFDTPSFNDSNLWFGVVVLLAFARCKIDQFFHFNEPTRDRHTRLMPTRNISVGRKEEWPLLLRSFKTISGCMAWVWKASSGLYQPLRHHYTPKWSESIGFCFGQFQPSVPVLFCKWYVVVWGMMAAASQLIQNTYW